MKNHLKKKREFKQKILKELKNSKNLKIGTKFIQNERINNAIWKGEMVQRQKRLWVYY